MIESARPDKVADESAARLPKRRWRRWWICLVLLLTLALGTILVGGYIDRVGNQFEHFGKGRQLRDHDIAGL